MTVEVFAPPREERLEGKGGVRIFVRSWQPEEQPRAVVLLVHGFNSHSGYYGWVAEQLTARGLAVYAMDLRGRGQSEGERFYVASFAEYICDVELVANLARARERTDLEEALGELRVEVRSLHIDGDASADLGLVEPRGSTGISSGPRAGEDAAALEEGLRDVRVRVVREALTEHRADDVRPSVLDDLGVRSVQSKLR